MQNKVRGNMRIVGKNETMKIERRWEYKNEFTEESALRLDCEGWVEVQQLELIKSHSR